MFEIVNEIAVLGTAFFMMGVATLWYSPHLFQRPWLRSVGLTEAGLEADAHNVKKKALLTYVSYVGVIFLIAEAIGYAELLGLSVQTVAISMAVAFAALMIGFVVWEQRSFMYYCITVGFSSVFIIGSSFLLYYWPW